MAPPAPRHLPNSPFNAAREAARPRQETYEIGDRVTHDRLGLGRVTGFDGDTGLHINFGGVTYRVSTSTTKLHRV